MIQQNGESPLKKRFGKRATWLILLASTAKLRERPVAQEPKEL